MTATDNTLHKKCNKCFLIRIPEGGVEISSTKWYCAKCWKKL